MAENSDALLVDRAEALVAAAKKAGADAADAVAVTRIAFGVDLREGQVEETERSEGDDLGLRVFVGKRQAIVSTNDMATGGYPALAERAVAMARIAPENPYAGLADPAALAASLPDLDLLDDTELEAETLVARAREAEEAARAVAGVTKSGGASASAGLGGLVLVTSTGFAGAYRRSRFSISMTAIAGDGTAMERDYAFDSKVHDADLDDPAEIGTKAGERAVARVNPRKMETRRAPVLFDRRVASSLLGHVSGAINGSAIARGSSFLRQALGTDIFPKTVTVTDDPTVPRGAASRPFDGDGLAAEPLTIIDAGRLTTWLLDTVTGRQLDLPSNGRASRGISGPPSPSATNLTLQPGTVSPEALMAEAGEGLLVTSMFGRGVDLVTGDYSRGVAGFWFEDGAIAYPVSEITIAGHLRDMFMALRVADDLEIRGAVNAPTVLVGEMTIAGQ